MKLTCEHCGNKTVVLIGTCQKCGITFCDRCAITADSELCADCETEFKDDVYAKNS